MAIFTPGAVVGQISGRIGGNIFSHNRGGMYIRNGSVPVSVQTEKALHYKAILSAASQAWTSLSESNRAAWTTFAQSKTVTNRLGRSVSLTAQNWFIKLNSRLMAALETPIDLPPTGDAPATVVPTDFEVDTTADTATLTFSPTPTGATEKLWIRAAKVQSPTIINVENLLTTVVITDAAAASPLDLTDELVAAFGPLQVGATYVLECRVLDTDSGYVGGRVFARCVAAAA